jgi:hypothetical protein
LPLFRQVKKLNLQACFILIVSGKKMASFPVLFLCPPNRSVYEENALRNAALYARTAEAKGEKHLFALERRCRLISPGGLLSVGVTG